MESHYSNFITFPPRSQEKKQGSDLCKSPVDNLVYNSTDRAYYIHPAIKKTEDGPLPVSPLPVSNSLLFMLPKVKNLQFYQIKQKTQLRPVFFDTPSRRVSISAMFVGHTLLDIRCPNIHSAGLIRE